MRFDSSNLMMMMMKRGGGGGTVGLTATTMTRRRIWWLVAMVLASSSWHDGSSILGFGCYFCHAQQQSIVYNNNNNNNNNNNKKPKIVGLALVQAGSSGNIVSNLTTNGTIITAVPLAGEEVQNLFYPKYNLQVWVVDVDDDETTTNSSNTTTMTTKSNNYTVQFDYSNGINNMNYSSTEFIPPYTMCGNIGSHLYKSCPNGILNIGNHTVTVTIMSVVGSSLLSSSSSGYTVQFAIVEATTTMTPTTSPNSPPVSTSTTTNTSGGGGGVIDFRLVYVPTQTEIVSLTNDVVLDLAPLVDDGLLPPNWEMKFNIVAITTSNIETVQFFPNQRMEHQTPFAYCGDDSLGNYWICDSMATRLNTTYTIVARSYTSYPDNGLIIPDVAISFTLINGTSTTTPTIPPAIPTTKAPAHAPATYPVVSAAPTMTTGTPVVALPPTAAPLITTPSAPPVPIVVVPTQPPTAMFQPILINCGELVYPYIDIKGQIWSTDMYYVGGMNASDSSSVNILATDDDTLYHTVRYSSNSSSVIYNIPVPNGIYNITIHWADTLFVNVRQRVFDMKIEGTVVSNIDIVQQGGGIAKKAVHMDFTTHVTNEILTIQFLPPPYNKNSKSFGVVVVNDPFVSAIEVHKAIVAPTVGPPPKAAPSAIVPTKTPVLPPKAPPQFPVAPTTTMTNPIRINCGGGAYNDTKGQLWNADMYFAGGKVYTAATTLDIMGTDDDVLYQSERYGPFTYNIPVPPGIYEVTLHMAEKYHKTKGKRVFDIDVDGTLIVDIDLVQQGGGVPLKAIRFVWNIPVLDGTLTIQFLENIPKLDNAQVCAIEVRPSINPPQAPYIMVPTKAPMNPPVPIAPVAAPDNFTSIYINSGGKAYNDTRGNLWSADKYFSGGRVYSNKAKDILGTLDDIIYQTERNGPVTYEIPVPIGTYEVTIHLAEIFFLLEGQRVFDINVEGSFIVDIDLVQQARGESFTATTRTLTVTVTDGSLTIQFLENIPKKGKAKVSGIEIHRSIPVAPSTKAPTLPPVPTVPPTTAAPTPFQTILINCGGDSYTDTSGQLWSADKFFIGGAVYSRTSTNILNTADDFIYQSERFGVFSYEIPIPIGNYQVILHFAELYFRSVGKRIFDVDVEGSLLANVDTVRQSGGVQNKAITRDIAVIVADGFLTVQFLLNDPPVNNPHVAGIEVKLIGPHFSHAVAGGPYFSVVADGNSTAAVAVDGGNSHTHNPGKELIRFTWKLGGRVIGNGVVSTLFLPVGEHTVTLTVEDSGGDSNSDSTLITIRSAGFPVLHSISPQSGSVAGGTTITIIGIDIGNVTAVNFGLARLGIGDITVVNATTIRVTSPYSGVGVPVPVSVVTPIGESSPLWFTYVGTTPISFTIGKLLNFTTPTAIAFGPDGKLYVGNTIGELGKFTLNGNYDEVVDSVIVTIVSSARGIHGIAFDPMESADVPNPTVYVATSDILHGESKNSFGLAINGKIQAVTGDRLENVTDIVTGLPVSDLDHTVNGIYFGNNGELYIAIGGNTNGGIPGELSTSQLLDESFFSGAILVANLREPGFNGIITYSSPINGDPLTGFGRQGVEIYAPGLRNPYGVVLHSNGHIYATDNGPNQRYGDMSTGCGPGEQIPDTEQKDKLVRIVRGAYYGHPNRKRGATDPRQCVWRAASTPSGNGYTAPMMILEASTDGIIEFDSDHFNGQMRGNLILSKYQDGLFRVILSRDGTTVVPASNPAISLGGDDGLVVVQAPNGNLIDGRYQKSACYYFKPNEVDSDVALVIKSVFPRRGALSGGTTLSIYGINFYGSPTILVGGNDCLNVIAVSSTLLKCTIPAGLAVGLQDIVVTVGQDLTDTFEKGYRYITGVPDLT